jgi:flavin reductase (DIM6/NTAB) family NADH-FMN oxidoreductase RutF
LSSPHHTIAAKLSRPGQDHSSLFASSPFTQPQQDGAVEITPKLPDAIGNLQCEIVSSLPLKDVCPMTEDEIEFDDEVEGAGLYKPTSPRPPRPEGESSGEWDGAAGDAAVRDGRIHGSELFICRVLEVEHGSGAEDPMVYWRHQYTSVKGQ